MEGLPIIKRSDTTHLTRGRLEVDDAYNLLVSLATGLASAANLAAQSSVNALLAVPPGTWSVVSTPGAGVVASAVKAAGAAGMRHVAWGIIVSFGAIAAPVATLLQWNLRDGASGAGTIIASGQVAVPAAAFASIIIPLTALNIPGTAATAMTLEFSAALANLAEGVTLVGYDAS